MHNFNTSGESLMWPTTWELLFTALCRILPEWVFSLLSRLPSRDTARLGHFRDVASKVSRPMFEKQLVEVANDANPAEKDIVNVLGMYPALHVSQYPSHFNQRCLISPTARKR